MSYIVEFHLRPEVAAQDRENLGSPERVGPFDTQEEAEAFAAQHSGFYIPVVVGLESELISPETWVSDWVGDFEGDDEVAVENRALFGIEETV